MSDSLPPAAPVPDPQRQPEPDPESDRPPQTFTLQPRPSLLRFLTEHNPFYLLSAACMLASCLALTNSLSWVSITPARLLTLAVTLNLYEGALLGIALFLITKRGLRRDGRMLLVLQAFFLADFSFLSAEMSTADVRAGIAFNLVLLLLAGLKIGVVLMVLRPSFTGLQFLFVLVQLGVLFATPVALRWLDGSRGTGTPRQFYVIWWVIALLPALYEAFARLDRRGRVTSVAPAAQAAPTTAYLALPFVSLLAHVGILHWVYRVDYMGAHAGPLLLGLTLVLNRFGPNALVPRNELVVLRLLLPAAAVLASMNTPFTFATPLAYPRLELTPFNLSVTGAFFVYLYCFLLPHARVVLAAGAAAAAMYLLGPTLQQVANATERGWDRGVTLAERLRPKTLAEWGAVGLVASFAFLAAGFWVSLRKQPDLPALDAPSEEGKTAG